ncbi:MAG TPA: hypothetical protein IAB01_02660 [Candidatus Avidesulfovibrio excrementigallinarum]|nr:hypothetical protein [Candidatus Avidesulfovibrio excrementigallinarum]
MSGKLIGKIIPDTLFGRLVSVGVFCILAVWVVSFWDAKLRSDSLYMRTLADVESRIFAHHIHLLSSQEPEWRVQLAGYLSQRKELHVELSDSPIPLQKGDPVLSQWLTDAVREELRTTGSHVQTVMGSTWFGRQTTKQSARLFDMALFNVSYSGRVEVSVELEDGQWLYIAHALENLPSKGLSRALRRLPAELFVIVIIAFVATLWIVRPLYRLTEALDKGLESEPLPENRGTVEIRNAAKAFNAMQLRLREFIRQRSLLFVSISHDLRTPLTRLRLRLEVLQDRDMRSAMLHDVENIQRNLDILIKTGRSLDMNLPSEEEERVNIMAMLETLVETRQDLGQQVTLTGHVDGAFWLPPQSFRNAIDNLLENAVRYGGGADMSVAREGDRLAIDVCDHGPGIPEEQLERVLEPFYRLETSRNPKTGGYGLGLAISRNLARKLGGDLTLKNLPEGGLHARFAIRLRAGKAADTF